MATYLVGATFLLAHTINAVMAEALLAPPVLSGPQTAAALPPPTSSPPSVLAEQVRVSKLFALPPEPIDIGVGPAGTVGPGATPARLPQPLNLASKLRLLGVVIGDQGGIWAIVELLSSKQQLFVTLHGQIPEVGEVSEIRRDGIVIRQGNLQELLELNPGQADKPPTPVPAAAQAAGTAPGLPIRKAFDRREIEQALSDLPKLLSQARAVPVMANGTMNGFRLDYIAPGSFYEKIGLRYGDVLKQVNGVEIKDPAMIMTLFQQLRNERSVKLDVLRNNQPTTMAYDIR
jgi:general secretion pathway protein C